MREDSSVTYWIDDKMAGNDWKGLSNNSNFYMNSQGNLVFVFDKYEVAPGALGVTEFEVPVYVVSDILLERFQG